MQLNFSRGDLIKWVRGFAGLIVIFGSEVVAAIWAENAIWFASGLILLLVALWCFAKSVWLIRSKAPAANVSERGIEIQNFAGHRNIPWNQIDSIGEAEVSSRRTTMKVIQIRRRGRPPIAFLIGSLSNSQAEIDRWIHLAQLRLA